MNLSMPPEGWADWVYTRTGQQRDLLSTSAKCELGNVRGYSTAVMFMAPHQEAGGKTVCPWSTVGCRALCLGVHAGHMRMTTHKVARVARARWWQGARESFLARLHMEIGLFTNRARKAGRVPCVRLNGSSDVLWERHGLPQAWPGVQFYDYTKAPLSVRLARGPLPANYRLHYSLSERPGALDEAHRWLDAGLNACLVLRTEREVGELVARGSFDGRPVLNGDLDDLRFLDPPGTWVALKAKGRPAKIDRSGFVLDLGGVR